jgi:hypothetical protein
MEEEEGNDGKETTGDKTLYSQEESLNCVGYLSEQNHCGRGVLKV